MGTGIIADNKRKFKSFNEFKIFIKGLNINSSKEYKKYLKNNSLQLDIPYNPDLVYKNSGWTNWPDILGKGMKGAKNIDYLSYDNAKKVIKKFELKTSTQWFEFCKTDSKPEKIPTSANRYYEKSGEWKGWADFLGKKD